MKTKRKHFRVNIDQQGTFKIVKNAFFCMSLCTDDLWLQLLHFTAMSFSSYFENNIGKRAIYCNHLYFQFWFDQNNIFHNTVYCSFVAWQMFYRILKCYCSVDRVRRGGGCRLFVGYCFLIEIIELRIIWSSVNLNYFPGPEDFKLSVVHCILIILRVKSSEQAKVKIKFSHNGIYFNLKAYSMQYDNSCQITKEPPPNALLKG